MLLFNHLRRGFLPAFAYFLIAAYTATALGCRREPTLADGREWSGRGYGAILIAWAMILQVYYLANP